MYCQTLVSMAPRVSRLRVEKRIARTRRDLRSLAICREPFYFARPPSESFSKRGREVSRHDVASMRGKPRLMALWEGESHLVLGIGGRRFFF